MTNNPYTTIQEVLDPMVEQVMEENQLTANPIIDLIFRDVYKGVLAAEGAIGEVYGFNSAAVVVVGDSWQYSVGDTGIATGKFKFKKFTIAAALSEDVWDRIQQFGMDGIYARELRNYLKTSIADAQAQLVKWIIDPWGGATTSDEYDVLYYGCWAGSNGGTLSNPSDLNSTPGTAANWASTVKLSGTAQTANIVTTVSTALGVLLTKVDYINKRKIPIGTIYMGVNSITAALLRKNRDILNSTTGQRSENTLIEDFAKAGIIVVEHEHFDSSYTYGDANTTTATFFVDPKTNWFMEVVPPPGGEGWSAWEKTKVEDDEKYYFNFEKHKKLELGVHPRAFLVHTSATASSYFKPVVRATITPFDDT